MESQRLGADVLLEILSRTPLQTLGRCRLVSKECNSLSYTSYFMRLHAQRTGTVSGFFLQTLISGKYLAEFVSENQKLSCKLSLNFLPGCAKILASANRGLMLCINTTPKIYRIPEYYLCKPSTKEWRQIPNPKTRYFTQRIAMMILRSSPLHYKILRLSDPNQFRNPNRKHANEYSFRCEIFDSETWRWKQLEEIYLSYGIILSFKPAVSVCGVFHWLTSVNSIFAFQADTETWRMLSFPDEIGVNSENKYDLTLSDYEGKLALVCMEREREEWFELWVMENYKKQEWRKRFTVSVKPLQIQELGFIPPRFEALYNVDIAMMSSYNKVYFYKFKNGSFDAVQLDNMFDYQGIFWFQSDKETIDQVRRSTRRESKKIINITMLLCLCFIVLQLFFFSS